MSPETKIDTNENRTPSFANIVRRIAEREIGKIYTMVPGRVESYDPAKQTATIKPLIRVPIPSTALDPDAGSDDQFTQELPSLPEIPVMFPRAKGATIYFPIYAGSLVMLIFSTFSLDKFHVTELSGGGTVDPQDIRRHHFSDAVAVPGFYPIAEPIPDLDDDDVRIILESQHNKRVEFGLGGDTGDIFLIPNDGSFVQSGKKEADEFGIMGETLKQYIDEKIVQAVNETYVKIKAVWTALKGHTHPYVDTPVGPSTTSPSADFVSIEDPTDLESPTDDILTEITKVS
jgi:hypothetical protein